MKLKATFGLLILTQCLSAQTFTEVLTSNSFEGVEGSSIAFADVDGDNDPDVLITGFGSSARISTLYLNDGAGNFIAATGNPFEGVHRGSIAFADVDGDNDPDVLITGETISGAQISTLYLNDGAGNFTEATGTPFEGIVIGSIAFADVDGDNDQDVLITGSNSLGARISTLYLNDGAGNFTAAPGTPFEGVFYSSIAFADVDGDNDPDVLITGANSLDARISTLYLNDGAGNFTAATGIPFEGVIYSSIAFADVDGDNDPDLLITGNNSSFAKTSTLYLNDGAGNFTAATGTPFEGIEDGSIAFTDVDGDNDPDVLITGQSSSGAPISTLYFNDGAGNFTAATGIPFEGVIYSSIAFADVDGDSDPDVLITGNSSNGGISTLYLNDGVMSSIREAMVEASLGMRLYPNPVKSNELHVSFDSHENGVVAVKVYDMMGACLSQHQAWVGNGPQTLAIDVASLASGCYIIQLDNGQRKGVAKFIVQ